MTVAEDLTTLANELGDSAEAAKARVEAALGEARTKIAEGLAEIQRLVDEDLAEESALAGVKDSLTATDAIIDSIEAAPAEEPPVEEPPVEEEPPTP